MKTGLFCMAAILCWLLAVPATRSLAAATGEKELSQADNAAQSGEADAADFDISSLVAEGFTAIPDLKVYPEREEPPCPWCTTFRIELQNTNWPSPSSDIRIYLPGIRTTTDSSPNPASALRPVRSFGLCDLRMIKHPFREYEDEDRNWLTLHPRQYLGLKVHVMHLEAGVMEVIAYYSDGKDPDSGSLKPTLLTAKAKVKSPPFESGWLRKIIGILETGSTEAKRCAASALQTHLKREGWAEIAVAAFVQLAREEAIRPNAFRPDGIIIMYDVRLRNIALYGIRAALRAVNGDTNDEIDIDFRDPQVVIERGEAYLSAHPEVIERYNDLIAESKEEESD